MNSETDMQNSNKPVRTYSLNISENDCKKNNVELERKKAIAVEFWANDPFYAPDSVVLGLDIGMEGIGICIRRGKEILYRKTLLVELPIADALADRRRKRSSRRSRKNKKLRMRRLRLLFQKHGLPWVSDDIMSRSDPFMLRHRAVTKKLASREALSICIRSMVKHRGYDYDALKESGEYLWGTSTKLIDVKSWLKTTYVDERIKQLIIEVEDELTVKNKTLGELDEKMAAPEREKLRNLIQERIEVSKKQDINAMTAAYASKHINVRKARKMNFPRALVESNLREILERHSHLVDNYEDFVRVLFHPCKKKDDKGIAIFHYNRKTPDECRDHFKNKVKDCPYYRWLVEDKKQEQKCCTNDDVWFRRWRLINFLSVRRFFLKTAADKKSPSERMLLPASVVEAIIATSVPDTGEFKKWVDVKKSIDNALSVAGYVGIDKGSDTPEQKQWNKDQLEALKPLCSLQPTARKGRANMCSASARELYNRVTVNGSCFEPEVMEAAKKEIGLYQKQNDIVLYGGIYPQVTQLLGVVGRPKRSKHEKVKDEDPVQKSTGLLQSIFKKLALKLGGKSVPDYVVVECIRDGAKNQEQKKEIKDEQKKKTANKDALKKKYDKDSEGLGRSKYFRMFLWEQQGGNIKKRAICPFTGKELPVDSPLDDSLELAHLFPDSKGGLYTLNNLVLTTREVNAAMTDMTPIEAAKTGVFRCSCEEMIARVKKLYAHQEIKLKYFLHENSDEYPDYENNMTRTSQLARQLRGQLAFWMGIAIGENVSEQQRIRIGNPHGELTAAMRRSIFGNDYVKDRNNHLHHSYDAALLTCMPPSGLNDVLYKGIFYTGYVPYKDKKTDQLKEHRAKFALTADDGLPLPDIKSAILDDSEPPVIKLRSRSKYKSLGDDTFWRVDKEGHTWQRTPLKVEKKTTVDSILQSFLHMGIKEELIPDAKYIQKWIDSQTPAFKDEVIVETPLLLKNGVPVKSIWKCDEKGSLANSPIKWTGIKNKNGIYQFVRNLREANDRMEIWIGWNSRKKKWEYQKRIMPTREAMKGIQRMGMSWNSMHGLPPYLQELLKKKKCNSLQEYISGTLFEGSKRVFSIRKGDVAEVEFKYDDENKQCPKEKHGMSEKMWGEVSSILTEGALEFKSLISKITKKSKVCDVGKIVALFGFFDDAETYAREHHLEKPKL